jgi:hypothetical protein
MKIYYKKDLITGQYYSKCPFFISNALAKEGIGGSDCQVGSITCAECEYCCNINDDEEIHHVYENDKFTLKPMPYVECMYDHLGLNDIPVWKRVQRIQFRIKRYIKYYVENFREIVFKLFEKIKKPTIS